MFTVLFLILRCHNTLASGNINAESLRIACPYSPELKLVAVGYVQWQAVPMTKAEEIEKLVLFARSFPRESYLFPWLNSVVAEVENEILSDFMVSPSLANTRARCDEMVKETNRHCAELVLSAQRQAKLAEDQSRELCHAIKSRCWQSLKTNARELGYDSL